jgi:hypothetical protein
MNNPETLAEEAGNAVMRAKANGSEELIVAPSMLSDLLDYIDTLQQEIRDRDHAAADTVDHLQQRLREVEEALRVIAAMDSAEDIEGHPTVYVEAAVDIARQALSTERTPT